jgi:hypothetical protein
MAYFPDAAKNDLSLKSLKSGISYRRSFYKSHKDYFLPDGLIIFTGSQGSGKTLSAVKYVCELMQMFPKCRLVTNVNILDFPIISYKDFLYNTYSDRVIKDYNSLSDITKKQLSEDYFILNRVFLFRSADDLKLHYNYENGVIYFIDEIQLYFNSLESKNINMEVMTEISQQRKQRKHIVATSQVFGRMAKPLREQFSTVVKCRCFLSSLQFNQYFLQEDVDLDSDSMHLKGKTNKIQLFFHKEHDYKNYDTYAKISDLTTSSGGFNFYDSTNTN